MQQFAAQEIGERIALARKEASGMTQPQLADLLNVSARSVQDYEAGVTIPWKYFTRLEEIFAKPLGWFLHGETASELNEEAATRLDRLEAHLDRIEALIRGQQPDAPDERAAQ